MPDEPDEHPEHDEGEHEHPEHHHHGPGDGRTTRDYIDDFFANWRTYEGSLAVKVALTMKNRARAYLLPPVKGCCGHSGQPGC